MSFFKRLSKLQSDIQSSGNELQVSVFDEEIGGKTPIMWLDGEIYDLEALPHLMEEEIDNIIEKEGYEETDKILYVGIVNFNDQLFYKLPEKRQNMAGVVLFKNFLKFYKENYGKNSGYWMPVSADFANYELQEKFKAEVEKGTFPPVSKLLLGETSASAWEESYYNMDNRNQANDGMEALMQYLKDQGVTLNDQGLVENFSLQQFIDIFNTEVQKNEVLNAFTTPSIKIGIVNGNVQYGLPLKNVSLADVSYIEFTLFDTEENQVFINKAVIDKSLQIILDAEENIRTVLGTLQIQTFDKYYTVDQFIDLVKEKAGLLQTASIKRLKKNNSSK